MEILLRANDYMDINLVGESGSSIHVGKVIPENGKESYVLENSFNNASFITFLKFLGYNLTDLKHEVESYVRDNSLFIRVKKLSNGTTVYSLNCTDTKEELISSTDFMGMMLNEVLQQNNSLYN